MHIIYPAAHTAHQPAQELFEGRFVPYYETAERVRLILAALDQAGFATPQVARAFPREQFLRVHSANYLNYLEYAYERWVAAGGSATAVLPEAFPQRGLPRYAADIRAQAGYYSFDLGAPIVAGTFAAAQDSANAALTGAALLAEGQTAAYALCRPPGHHAARDLCGGYCYLNNAALAADYLAQVAGKAGSGAWGLPAPAVALLDIDYHHGNGSQQIFYARSDVLVVSLHADPQREYPYFLGNADERGSEAGTGYNLNLPLPPAINDNAYLAVLDQALEEIAAFGSKYLVISAGFDTFRNDPIGDFALSEAAYPAIGARIAALHLPTLFVQEGGYAIEKLGSNLVGLLQGFLA
jgi:acetoin utilization deacetylase AcuC-like enzyme